MSDLPGPFYANNAAVAGMEETVVGGASSVLGGGKFANGAVTAAFSFVFNHMGDLPDCGDEDICAPMEPVPEENGSNGVVQQIIPGGGTLEGAALDAAAIEFGGAAESALAAPALANQLKAESAASAFEAGGALSEEALAGSQEIIPSADIGNPAVPSGFSKFRTQTYQSPSGNFRVHFYMNRTTGEPFYGLDYKAVFNSGRAGP